MRVSKPRNRAALAVLALATAGAFVLPAGSASAGTTTVSNACANSVTANFSQIDVTTSGDDGLTTVAPGGTIMTTGLSQSAAIPGDIFVAGYNLGLLVVGPNNIPANVRSTIEATNTIQGVQNTNTVGGTPPDGTVTVSTTITDPDGIPGTGDETATPASFSVNYNNLSWTAGASGTIDYRQQSIPTAPPTNAANSLFIAALVGGVFGVAFRCAPGTVTPPDPGTITLIDPAPSFDTTYIDLGPPVANAGPDQTVAPGALVNLDATGSTDPDLPNDMLTYSWTQLSGTPVTLSDPSSVTPTFTVPAGFGIWEFQVQVCDQAAQCSTDTMVASVLVDHPPIADAGPDQTVSTGDLVQLDGTGSVDPSGEALTYAWTQTAGPSVTLTGADTATPSFTAPTGPATLMFELTVTNTDGATGTDSVTVNVQAPPMIDATGIVILNGPVTSAKTSKSFTFKVSNVGLVAIALIPGTDITSSGDVNGTPTGSVSPGSGTKTLNPGASTRVKLVWRYPAGALAAGDAVAFHACVNVAGDIDTSNDCDDQTATAK